MDSKIFHLKPNQAVVFPDGSIVNDDRHSVIRLIGSFGSAEVVTLPKGEQVKGFKQDFRSGQGMHLAAGKVENATENRRRFLFSAGLKTLSENLYIDPNTDGDDPLASFQLAVQKHYFSYSGDLVGVEEACATVRTASGEHENLIAKVWRKVQDDKSYGAIRDINRVRLNPR